MSHPTQRSHSVSLFLSSYCGDNDGIYKSPGGDARLGTRTPGQPVCTDCAVMPSSCSHSERSPCHLAFFISQPLSLCPMLSAPCNSRAPAASACPAFALGASAQHLPGLCLRASCSYPKAQTPADPSHTPTRTQGLIYFFLSLFFRHSAVPSCVQFLPGRQRLLFAHLLVPGR